jgi:predicted kinase
VAARWTLGAGMSVERAKLYFMCGKMAAGKSTHARELARKRNAVLLIQDELLDALYPGEIRDIKDFVKYSSRLRDALSLHIQDLLARDISVVLDFPANTTAQRRWFRELVGGAGVEHELHFVDVPDDLCKLQLRQRSDALPAGSPWTTEAEFDAITAYFQAPTEDEGFNVIRLERV